MHEMVWDSLFNLFTCQGCGLSLTKRFVYDSRYNDGTRLKTAVAALALQEMSGDCARHEKGGQ